MEHLNLQTPPPPLSPANCCLDPEIWVSCRIKVIPFLLVTAYGITISMIIRWRGNFSKTRNFYLLNHRLLHSPLIRRVSLPHPPPLHHHEPEGRACLCRSQASMPPHPLPQILASRILSHQLEGTSLENG